MINRNDDRTFLLTREHLKLLSQVDISAMMANPDDVTKWRPRRGARGQVLPPVAIVSSGPFAHTIVGPTPMGRDPDEDLLKDIPKVLQIIAGSQKIREGLFVKIDAADPSSWRFVPEN